MKVLVKYQNSVVESVVTSVHFVNSNDGKISALLIP